ncbi:hypothetical protein ACOSP7_028738 [Xanthoceras sorbifolium]
MRRMVVVCKNFKVMFDCGLMDMGFRRYKYAWSNRQFRGKFIHERLYRAMCCLSWRSLFPDAVVIYKDYLGSDNRVLFLKRVLKNNSNQNRGDRDESGFHFEQAWGDEVNCRKIV